MFTDISSPLSAVSLAAERRPYDPRSLLLLRWGCGVPVRGEGSVRACCRAMLCAAAAAGAHALTLRHLPPSASAAFRWRSPSPSAPLCTTPPPEPAFGRHSSSASTATGHTQQSAVSVTNGGQTAVTRRRPDETTAEGGSARTVRSACSFLCLRVAQSAPRVSLARLLCLRTCFLRFPDVSLQPSSDH